MSVKELIYDLNYWYEGTKQGKPSAIRQFYLAYDQLLRRGVRFFMRGSGQWVIGP